MASEEEGGTPRTDICEECEREIVPDIEKVTGQHELIHGARQSDEGFMPVTGGSVEVVFSCRCSSMRVEYGPGSTSAWKVPDEWMWEDEVDIPEEDDQEIRTDGGVVEGGSGRLRPIEQMAWEYERGAENRGEEINAANYRNIRTAIKNLRRDLDGDDSRTDGGLQHTRRSDAELATLAFAAEYVPAIRAGEKTVTLRRPGAYDVAVRHAAERDTEIVLVDDDGEPFARAAIRAVWKVDAEAVAEARLAGYPDVACADDVVRILERHYELEIEGDAEHVRVHAIHFDVTELLRPAVLEGGEA